jgi:hypothetical protein
MDVTKSRIFCAEQIKVPQDLPNIIKDYTKELIKENPSADETGEEVREYREKVKLYLPRSSSRRIRARMRPERR